jgi:hypothetical protein
MKLLKVVALALSLASSVTAGYIQNPNLKLPDNAKERQEAAKKLFTDSYEAYRYAVVVRYVP